MPVAQLKLGMHILRADGRYGVIGGDIAQPALDKSPPNGLPL
jgi:hypothetical protein